MNRTGYSFLTDDQLEFVYGRRSPYNNSGQLTFFRSLNKTQKEAQIDSTIHQMAKRDSFSVRRKDILLSPILFTVSLLVPRLVSQPIILS